MSPTQSGEHLFYLTYQAQMASSVRLLASSVLSCTLSAPPFSSAAPYILASSSLIALLLVYLLRFSVPFSSLWGAQNPINSPYRSLPFAPALTC